MIESWITLPQDIWFIVAGWGVILGGLGLYAATLLRRLAAARDASLRIRREAESAESADVRDDRR
ncbi:MAG TPA: hypothetical protein VHK28_01770 [Candidatus Limnocylindria bacterium]|nr:hypothetical protein [Candidatus Limnocylindria bacterium]